MPVDFKKLHDAWYAGLDDEARARFDARRALEAEWDETADEIMAVFEREERASEATGPLPPVRRRPGMMFRHARPGPRPAGGGALPGTEVVRTWQKPIKVRIEDSTDWRGNPRAILRFIGGPTGHEAYPLDEEFCARLVDPEERRMRPRLYVCAGSPGGWHACSIDPADLEAYLRRHRPHLFPGRSPAPGM